MKGMMPHWLPSTNYYYLRHKQGTNDGEGSTILESPPREPARNGSLPVLAANTRMENDDWQMGRRRELDAR